jgi:hypothetical protein
MSAKRERLYKEWRRLVNMTARQLRTFLDRYGNVAGLSRGEAKAEGVRSGRDSARALLKMIPEGTSFKRASDRWTEAQWSWASRQVAFIRRMRGMPGPLYNARGEPTRKLLSLKLWGHDPEKRMRRNAVATQASTDLDAVVLAVLTDRPLPTADSIRRRVLDMGEPADFMMLSPDDQVFEVRDALVRLQALGLVSQPEPAYAAVRR